MPAKSKILVVDDNTSVRATMQSWLTAFDYEVITAESGSVALQESTHAGVGAALVDVHMPGMCGVEVCRALRAAIPDLPVWLMTGAFTEEIKNAAAAAGARAVLTKPFDLTLLLSNLEEALA